MTWALLVLQLAPLVLQIAKEAPELIGAIQKVVEGFQKLEPETREQLVATATALASQDEHALEKITRAMA